jgi:hypothetical protein
MTYPQFTPYPPSMADNIAYTQQLADAIMRNNPLVNAVIPNGLMKWYGNYQNPDSSQVNFLWIGEFLPADPNMGGKAQRGFSLVRDDSTHSSAISMLDPSPGVPLKQIVTISSYDNKPMLSESRNQGGISFPYQQIPMGRTDGISSAFPHTSNTTVSSLAEGRFSATGYQLHYRLWALTDSGVTAQVRVRVQDGATVVTGAWNSVPSAGNLIFDFNLDITPVRGNKDVNVFVEAQVLSGAGNVYCSPIVMSCFSS